MRVADNHELDPTLTQPPQAFDGVPQPESIHRGMSGFNRLLVVGIPAAVAALAVGATSPSPAEAVQRGDTAVQLDGRLNSVIGTQAVRFNGEYTLRIDKQMIENYEKTCPFAVDPWDNLRRIFALGSQYPNNAIYRDMKRTGGAIVRKDPYLKEYKGITIRVPLCGDSANPRAGQQLPEWEAVTREQVRSGNFDNETPAIKARTGCNAFPDAWWKYRVEKMNPGYFEEFLFDWRIQLPGTIGIRIRFGETDPVTVPVCTKQSRNNFVSVPGGVPKRKIYARDVRAEVAAQTQSLESDELSVARQGLARSRVELAGRLF